MKTLSDYRHILEGIDLTPNGANLHGLSVNHDGLRRNGMSLLALPNVKFNDMQRIEGKLRECPFWVQELLETEAHYAVYLARQKLDIQRVKNDQAIIIPDEFDYTLHKGFSSELQSKLKIHRPKSIADAAEIEGMTPSALVLLAALLRRERKAISGS